jgi:hypothetical protein
MENMVDYLVVRFAEKTRWFKQTGILRLIMPTSKECRYSSEETEDAVNIIITQCKLLMNALSNFFPVSQSLQHHLDISSAQSL